MLFNSYEFLLFLPTVLLLLAVAPRRARNGVLLVASYVFYGAWDVYFLSLIFLSTLLDFYCGLGIGRTRDRRIRRRFLWASVGGNLLVLGFFKYFDFFSRSLGELLRALGIEASPVVLGIMVPVGISFYTFQTMSYTIDVHRGKLRPCRSFGDFALYVAFFPQLVAGPIERATNLLPQIADTGRRVSREAIMEGGWLVFWGFHKKVFVADNLARLVDPVYSDPGAMPAPLIVLAAVAFTIQIYCDFSGYTDIARGVAKWLGFNLMLNFNLPYFAVDPSDFWRRWHISLSIWLRDYLYIPLGGSRGSQGRVLFNLMLTMALGGLWHGAHWTYIIWGLYHGVLLVAYRALAPGVHAGITGARKLLAIAVMFFWTALGMALFRVESIGDYAAFARSLLDNWGGGEVWLLWNGAYSAFGVAEYAVLLVVYCAVLLAVQVVQYVKGDLEIVLRAPVVLRVLLYVVMYFSITLGGAFDGRQFIYFVF